MLALKPFGLSPAALVANGYQLGEGKRRGVSWCSGFSPAVFRCLRSKPLFEVLPTRPGGALQEFVECAACPFAPLGLPERGADRPTIAKWSSTMLAPLKAKRLVPRRRYASLDRGCAWC